MKNLICLVFLVLFFSCNQEKKQKQTLRSITGTTMGTTFSIQYFGQEDYKSQIDSLLVEINQSVSTYIKSSTISKVNQAKPSKIEIDKHFKTNFEEAVKIYEATEGSFNPAIMPLVNYWGFGYEKFDPSKDIDSSMVERLRQLADFSKFTLEGNQLTKTLENSQLDFSALAKGYGVDQVGQFLANEGLNSFLVEIGGETLAKGFKFNEKPWMVGIRKPSIYFEDRKSISEAFPLINKAMATSGNYERFKVLEDKRTIAHTIDPSTGFPQEINAQILSSTVLADQCMIADGYATAFKVMGLEKSIRVAQMHPELQVYLIYSDHGELKTWTNMKKD